MRLLGPIRDGGGASKPAAKPPTKTKAQIEADERAKAAEAARQAAANAEAARQRKAEVERQERAQEAARQAAKQAAIESEARRDAAMAARAPTPTSRSNQGRRPDGWNQTVHNNRNSLTSSTSRSGSSTPAASPPPPPPPPPPSPPPTVKAIPVSIEFPPPPTYDTVKAAPIDTVLFADESFSQEFITDLLFEDVAGQELLIIGREDTVNGQEVIYQPFKNLGILRDTYDINNLLKIQETSDRFFANFSINLFEKIPRVGSGPDGKNYYFDEVTGDGIIEFINMREDEQVEIQISNAGIIEEVGI